MFSVSKGFCSLPLSTSIFWKHISQSSQWNPANQILFCVQTSNPEPPAVSLMQLGWMTLSLVIQAWKKKHLEKLNSNMSLHNQYGYSKAACEQFLLTPSAVWAVFSNKVKWFLVMTWLMSEIPPHRSWHLLIWLPAGSNVSAWTPPGVSGVNIE